MLEIILFLAKQNKSFL